MDNRQKLMAFMTTALVLTLIPCGAFAQPVVKVGNILPLSGPSASVGLQNKQAQDMAVEEINQAGGIKSLGGAKIQMFYADSESKPEKGVAEAERFINTEKVNVLTGCWNSAVSCPVSAVAERYSIPFIVPVSVADKITEQGFKNVFRIAAKDSWWTRDQFAFLKDMEKEFNVKVSTVALVYENSDWGKGCRRLGEAGQKGGYKVVLDEVSLPRLTQPGSAEDQARQSGRPFSYLQRRGRHPAYQHYGRVQSKTQGHHRQRRRSRRPLLS
jgi:branched-chain amino acid transport system substrate-binding protein